MWFGSFEIAVLLPNEALRVERLKTGRRALSRPAGLKLQSGTW